MPVRLYQAATSVLPPAARRAILPEGHVVTDTRRNAFAMRWTPDGRLLTGGLVGPSLRSSKVAAARHYERRLARFCARSLEEAGLEAGSVRMDRVWAGRIAVTGTGLPAMSRRSDTVTELVACNGRGVALGTAIGTLVGRALGEAALARTVPDFSIVPLSIVRPATRRLRHVSRIGARLMAVRASIADAVEARQG